MKGFLFLICLIQFLFVNSEDMCCETCTNEGTQKYYSIDTSHDRCGECCMAPENFTIFKRFETGLTEATVDHPCHELGYTEYEITETHGAAGYYMTLDKYKKQDMCCENCTDEGTKKYYSIDISHDRCGECCMAPENYTIFKRFETGLTEATVDHPCHELGYTEYEITETHGTAGYYMTLDKYKKLESSDNSTTGGGESTDEQTLNHTRFFRSHSSKGLKGGHITAIVLCCIAVVVAVAATIGVTKGLTSGTTGAISNVSVDNSSTINKLNFNK